MTLDFYDRLETVSIIIFITVRWGQVVLWYWSWTAMTTSSDQLVMYVFISF